jgi:3'(2'), 5'-bisphosphate nucleotidase
MHELNTFFQECLSRALLAAKTAGEAILSVYQDHIDVTYKDDKTPLTLADERAHAIISSRLSEGGLKQPPVLSEEGKHTPYDTRKTWEYFWLVDPLDGTKEFIKRRGEFTVNIALIKKNKPVLGVVFVPVTGFLYFAVEGLGSYKLEGAEVLSQCLNNNDMSGEGSISIDRIVNFANKLPLDRPPGSSGKKVTMVGSRSHGSKALEHFVRTAQQRYGDVEFRPAGSALKFGLIAEGTVQIYPRLGPTMEWDTAAGQCVVEQSGGAVLRLPERTPLDYNKRDLRNPHFICTGKHSNALDALFQLT